MRIWGRWLAIEDSGPVTPRLDLTDADDPQGDPHAEKKFVIQLQATHSDNYADKLTAAQLEPITRSVYGTVRFAYPVSRTSHHDMLAGTCTLLAFASPETYATWSCIDKWKDISRHLLSDYWRIILVAEVDLRCETAEIALLSLSRANGGRSGSE